MKKLLSLLLALAMLLGCTAFAEGVDYTGTWVLTGAEYEGVQMGPSALAAIGLDMTMVLAADGTLTLTTMGMEEAGTWVATETGIAITDEAETLDVLYQNDMLVLEESGSLMMLTREGAAPAIAEATGPVALAGVAPEAFEGQWLMTHVSFMGMELTAEDMGIYMALVLTEGAGLLGTTDENGEAIAENITYTISEVEGVGTMIEIASAQAAEESVLSLCMAEDGTLYLEESGMFMFFTKQVEETAAE